MILLCLFVLGLASCSNQSSTEIKNSSEITTTKVEQLYFESADDGAGNKYNQTIHISKNQSVTLYPILRTVTTIRSPVPTATAIPSIGESSSFVTYTTETFTNLPAEWKLEGDIGRISIYSNGFGAKFTGTKFGDGQLNVTVNQVKYPIQLKVSDISMLYSIAQPTNGFFVNALNQQQILFSGVCANPDEFLFITSTEVSMPLLQTSCKADKTWSANVDMSGLTDNYSSLSLKVSSTTNTALLNLSYFKDSLPPQATTYETPANAALNEYYSLTSTPILTVNLPLIDQGMAGIKHYEHRVLRAADQSVIQDWTTFGFTLTLQVNGLSLEEETIYQLDIRTVDQAGNQSPTSSYFWRPHREREPFADLPPITAGTTITFNTSTTIDTSVYDRSHPLTADTLTINNSTISPAANKPTAMFIRTNHLILFNSAITAHGQDGGAPVTGVAGAGGAGGSGGGNGRGNTTYYGGFGGSYGLSGYGNDPGTGPIGIGYSSLITPYTFWGWGGNGSGYTGAGHAANGGGGGGSSGFTNFDTPGAGGGGGLIVLVVYQSISGTSSLRANGGTGGTFSYNIQFDGGGGTIVVIAKSYSANFENMIFVSPGNNGTTKIAGYGNARIFQLLSDNSTILERSFTESW